jgi:hypothetical protein
MDDIHRKWAIRAGIGTGLCALMTAWLVPNTTPKANPSVIAGMAGTAEAQKPTYSAVPDSAIPAWAASLQQTPSASPAPASAPSPDPIQIADTAPMPDPAPTVAESTGDAGMTADPAPPPAPTDVPVSRTTQPPQVQAAPATPHDDYQARRAAWRSQLDSVMQGQTASGDSG